MTTSTSSRQRRLVRGTALAAVAATALVGAYALGVANDASDRAGNLTAGGPDGKVGGDSGSLNRATSCDRLLDWYVEQGTKTVTPWGWGYGMPYLDGGSDTMIEEDGGADASAPAPTDSQRDGTGTSDTGTNVQETGVDEPDVAKTDGTTLVRVDGDNLTTYDVTGDRPEKLAMIDMPGSGYAADSEVLLVGDRALVFGENKPRWDSPAATLMFTVDISDPAEPEVVGEQEFSGSLLSVRLYDDTVRLVIGGQLPDLDFVTPDDDRSESEALATNQDKIRNSDIDDWLPTVTAGSGDDRSRLLDCEEMMLPDDDAGPGSAVIVSFPAEDARDRDAVGVATSSDIVYSSTDRLYLATSSNPWTWDGFNGDVRFDDAPTDTPDGTTDLHSFELSGTSTTYIGSGQVDGTVADRWSLDSADDVLRVAVGPSSETGNDNAVVTMRERGGRLEEIGRVDRLGVDEEIKSVRWFDDLAVVVTFRQTDPLYAIDLSNPSRPVNRGHLKIPGFSDYLHPIGGERLIGIGSDADPETGMTRGGQAAVFDISDLAQPARIAKHNYGQRWQTVAGWEPRQFVWLPGSDTALTVVQKYGRNGGLEARVSVLAVRGNGTLDTSSRSGTTGYEDAASLRMTPLPDGRVVLSHAEGARILDL